MKMQTPLATVGNVNVDLILGPVAPWPAPGSEVLCPQDELRVGGAAGNVALAWQAMGLPFQCAASTGSDHYGDWLRAGFGAIARGWTRSAAKTALSVGVTHPDGERTFLSTLGHLPELTWPEVEGQIDWARLKGGTLLLCGCFLMNRLVADYDLLFDRAAASGVKVALDTGWPVEGWTDAVRARMRGWVGRSAMVLLNEVEAMNLTGASEAKGALSALAALLPEGGIAVVKLGPKGAMAQQNGQSCAAKAPRVTVCDTIGAGDVFNAAFLAALAQGVPLAPALESAVATASRAVSTSPRSYTTQEVLA